MKIVINACYGGFRLSSFGVIEYNKRKGKKTYFYNCNMQDSLSELEKVTPDDSRAFSNWIYATTVDLGYRPHHSMFTFSFGADEHKEPNVTDVSNIDRTDPDLIAIIERFGPKNVGSKLSDLKVVEIPDDIEWEIDEYDGLEIIREKHRTWC